MSAPEFPKIETLYDRGDDGLVVDSVGRSYGIRCPEFNLIKRWLVTEKIDGTNIRVSLEKRPSIGLPDTVWELHFAGRTDKADIPTFLRAHLEETFRPGMLERLWRGRKDCGLCGGSGRVTVYDTPDPAKRKIIQIGCSCIDRGYPITLFGEGYGPRIQRGGGNYRKDVSFRLFDVLVDNTYWLDWAGVCDVAGKLGIQTVPCISRHMPTEHIVILVQYGLASTVAAEDRADEPLRESDLPRAEGVVARTDPYLFDKHGRPVRFKLKTKDFTRR